MNTEEMGHWADRTAMTTTFARSALALALSILAAAAPLAMIAAFTNQTGSGAPLGVAVAAAVCLGVGLVAELISRLLHQAVSPLAAMGAGIAARFVPLLALCVVLGLNGGGREHLAFVLYLLAFYFVVLALDTWWAIGRVADRSRSNT